VGGDWVDVPLPGKFGGQDISPLFILIFKNRF